MVGTPSTGWKMQGGADRRTLTHQVIESIGQLLDHLQLPAGGHQGTALTQVSVHCSQGHKFLDHGAWQQRERTKSGGEKKNRTEFSRLCCKQLLDEVRVQRGCASYPKLHSKGNPGVSELGD